MSARRLVTYALLALAGVAHAESCSELNAKADALRGEMGRIERDAVAGDARLLECQGALAAIFAERREMKQAAEPAQWEASATRLAIELQLVAGTLDARPLTRPQGDPVRPVDEALDTAVSAGVFTLTGDGATRLDALAAAGQATRAPHVHTAAVAALREQLALMDAASEAGIAGAGPLPEPARPDKLTRKYEDADAAFDAPAAANLRPRAAALDAALATLQLAVEHERRPSEVAREALEKKAQELARLQARIAACTGP